MSRLTRYHQESLLTDEGGYYEPDKSNYMDITNKLGKLEDLMDKYSINDLAELEIALDYYHHRWDGGVYTERVGKNEENELDVYTLIKIFKALKEDTIIYNNMVCEGISIYRGGRNRLCFALDYCGEKGIRIDEVDVLKTDWRLNDE